MVSTPTQIHQSTHTHTALHTHTHTHTKHTKIKNQNIDTDQIIPAEYLTLVPSKPDEYEKLGSYALIGLPDEEYPER
jgi:3-isopropylmalate dehydratase small subunit